MEVGMNADIPLSDEQLKIVGLIGVLALAVVAAPMLLMPSDDTEIEPNNGTVVTPDGTELQEVDGGIDRGPLGGLNAIPASHLRDDESPTVHASAGAQTMRVETTTVNGEAALNLTDERTHDGRWVSVPTEWFNRTQGGVPSVARIAHEQNGTYTETIQVRGDSAAFYVRGFSTNTVTFGGELVIRDQPAVDGTRHTYQLDSRDSVNDVSINVTGVENTESASTSLSATDGDTFPIDVGGTTAPRDETITLTGIEQTSSGSLSPGTVSDGYSTEVDVSGNQLTRDGSVTFSGKETTDSRSASGMLSDSSGDSVSVGGNQDVSGDLTVSPKTVTNSNTGDYVNYLEVDVSNMDTLTEVHLEGGGYEEGVGVNDEQGNEILYESGKQWYPITYNVNYDVSDDAYIAVNPTQSYNNLEKVTVTGTQDGEEVTVSVGSDSASFGTVSSSQTKSVSLSPGTESIDLSTSNGVSLNYDLSWTDQTLTEDPSATIGGSTVSHSGTLSDGETVTKSLSLSPGPSQSVSVSTGGEVGVDASWTEVTATEDPSVNVGGSTVSHPGILGPGETVSESVDLSTGSQSADVSVDGPVDVEASWTEVSETRDPVVELNGQSTSYTGSLNDGETVSLDANASWLQDGQNNVTVHVGDGSYSGEGPEPQVELEYRHDLESPRTVDYESEALSERYNISKTYTTPRANATLTIPHARTVLSMRALDYRLNETGSWSSVPQSAANLSGTTLDVDVSALAGDPVPEGTTVEVRSTGSRVDAHDSEISVVRATPVGFDLDSRVRLDSWSSGSYLEVGETPQGALVHYARNESYSAESDYVELYGDGSQRFYAPNASSGSEVTLNTLSARVSPERNSMRVRVPESANATNTEFVVEPASVVGDSWSAEYVAGTDGQWYAVVDGSGEELGAAEKPDPITVDRDDVGLVSIEPTDPPSQSTDSVGGGVFATATTGNLPSLIVLFGSVAMLFVAGTRPASSRDAIDGIAAGVGGLLGRVPRIGGTLGSAVESGLSSVGGGLVTVGENRLLTGAIGAAVAVAAAEADLFSIGSEAGAIIAVAGIAVGSLFLLRQADEFTTARWIAIVGIAGVVALQGLGEGDLLSEFVNSDAFLIAVLIGGYALIQLVREYRANNAPDDDQPRIVIGGRFQSGDDEGSD